MSFSSAITTDNLCYTYFIISSTSTVESISTLFRGHPSLIDGLRSFLDGRYSMSTPKAVVSSDRELTAKDAFDYLDLVKAQFKDRPEVYDQFLDIMKGFKART